MHIPKLHTNISKALSQVTSLDALLLIANDLQLGFSDNLTENTNDKMTWLIPNYSYKSAITHICKMAYSNEKQFFDCFIDRYYMLNFINVEKQFEKIDDDKELDDYTAKDWEELIQANLEEKANQVRRETPKQFFQSLPQELQIAAKYVADGGKDLKGLFTTLGQVEETKTIDTKSVIGQERVIKEYLSATGYGTAEDIQEEIEIWKERLRHC